MKVYLLIKDYGYDGYDVVDIYANIELAIVGAEKIMAEDNSSKWKEIEADVYVKSWAPDTFWPIIEIEERELICVEG